jgi:hypothetical protein
MDKSLSDNVLETYTGIGSVRRKTTMEVLQWHFILSGWSLKKYIAIIKCCFYVKISRAKKKNLLTPFRVHMYLLLDLKFSRL